MIYHFMFILYLWFRYTFRVRFKKGLKKFGVYIGKDSLI